MEVEMKRLTLIASVSSLAILVPTAAASAAPVTHQHAVQYGRAYAHARHVFGKESIGCKLIGPKSTCHQNVNDKSIATSLGVLHRMFNAIPVRAATATPVSSYTPTGAPTYNPTATGSSGLAACIISRESGGNSQAANASGHTGEAQWSQQSWAGGGGTQYAPTPLGASPAQQTAVLNSMLANGQAGQWTPWDGC